MIAFVVLALAAMPAEPTRTFALVVGHNVAADPATPVLRFADDDAVAMHELLLEAGARSVLLVGADAETRATHPGTAGALRPTSEAIEAAWAQLRREMQAAASSGPVEFIFFFSGHGDVSNGEGYLSLDGGRLTRNAVQALLSQSPAERNHVIIDACKAYFAVLGKGPGGRREPYLQPFVGAGRETARSGFVLSTSSDGDAHEWDRYQAGVFSFEVRSGLRGSADVNGDGAITYRELGGFLQRANAGIVSSKFRPDFLVMPPGGAASALDTPVLRWKPDSAALKLDGGARHIYVELATGVRVLEVHRAESSVLAVRLPAQRPLFIRTADELEERVLESKEMTELSSLSPAPASINRKGALQLAFRQLFSQPFDAAAVESFGVEFSLRTPSGSPDSGPREVAKVASLVTAGTAFAVGGAALLVGLERRAVDAHTSHAERVQRNEGIAAANVTMVVADVVGVAALGAWGVMMLVGPRDSTAQVSLGVSPTGVSVNGRW